MATATPPIKRSLNLGEAQQRVRHPLERVRGTIRTYVGLEGAALLLTLLALWFWVSFVLDFGPFRAFGWDWVQEVSRPVRALCLGGFFLVAVILLRVELIARVFGSEARAVFRLAFASADKRQTLPVWLRLPLVGVGVTAVAWVGDFVTTTVVHPALDAFFHPALDAFFLLAIPLTGLLISGAHELFGVRSRVSRWVRAPVAGLGCAAGAFCGAFFGYALAQNVGAIVGSGLMAMFGDVFALIVLGVVVGLLRGRNYLFALALPCVGVYLLGWVAAGLLAAWGGLLAGALVTLLMVGPVLAVLAARLLRDFRDDALALVLERRFPRVLGDRLITAVELANPKKAARYGYSEVMIEQTIYDAAERVQTVPVREVFDWARLYRHWGLVALLTVGLYLVFGGLFCIPAVGETAGGERAGFAAFHQAAGLALERNLLLQNTIWPRRAYLQILDWPDSGEKRIGKDDSAPGIKVRAYKWVVADSQSREGWRALTWNDLTDKQYLMNEPAPAVTLPPDWGEPRDPQAGWSLDEIELRLAREEAHANLDPDTKDALRDVLSKLEQRAADPAMRRTLRMLIVPAQVFVVYKGQSGGGKVTLDRQGDNEYAGQFSDLKESVAFTARGEDYETGRYRITVVPRPSLAELVVDEERPAYIYYRAPGDDPNALRGLKQLVGGRQISVTGGDTSRIDPVPAGSNVILTAKSDKELKEVTIPEPRKGVAAVKADVQLLDSRTFRVRFDDVKATPERPAYDFYFRMVDTDGVVGQRHVVIKPHEDAVPDVSISVNSIIPKRSQGYLITPWASVPLEAKVVDDNGLHLVEYAGTVSKLDRQAEQGARGLAVLSAMHLLPGGPGLEFAAAARVAALSREAKAGPKGGAETDVQRFPALTFVKPPGEYPPLDRIKANLTHPKPLDVALTKRFDIEKFEEKDPRNKDDARYFFSVAQVKNAEGKSLKADSPDEVQPRYRVQLWVEAVDTDVETGRDVLKTDKGDAYRGNRGSSKEKLTFIIVSESELLTEIAKEEETLYIKLGEQVRKLQEGRDKLDLLKEFLTAEKVKPEQFSNIQARTDELVQSLDKAETDVRQVSDDYQRILRELITNAGEKPPIDSALPAMIEKVQEQIVKPLNVAVNGNDEDKSARDTFPRTRAGLGELRTVAAKEGDFAAKVAETRATADEARLRLDALIRRLADVMEKMERLSDINKIIKLLQEVEQEENRQKGVLKKIKDQLEDELLKGLRPDKP